MSWAWPVAALIGVATVLGGCARGEDDERDAVVPCEQYRFDRAAWNVPGSAKEIPGPRQREAERLVGCDVLRGMTRREVVSMLGTKGLLRHPRSVEYKLGVISAMYLDADWMEIHFDRDDRVSRINMGKTPGEH